MKQKKVTHKLYLFKQFSHLIFISSTKVKMANMAVKYTVFNTPKPFHKCLCKRKGNSNEIHKFRLRIFFYDFSLNGMCFYRKVKKWIKSYSSGCGFFRQMVSTDQLIRRLRNGRRIDSFTKCHQIQYMKNRKSLEFVLWYLILVTAWLVK